MRNITPTTRTYLLACLALAFLHAIGLPEELFLFEPGRAFFKGQIWRPFTSACFLGKVDMSMASNIYFLINYGQEMERQDGSPQQAMFLLSQVFLLVIFCSLIGVPSFARSLITASIYCCSRREPLRAMEIQFGIRIEYWLLPFVNMVVDILQSQSPAGAVPHILGILTGHIYHFFSIIWPKMGGKRYFVAPEAFASALTASKDEDDAVIKKASSKAKKQTAGTSSKKKKKTSNDSSSDTKKKKKSKGKSKAKGKKAGSKKSKASKSDDD